MACLQAGIRSLETDGVLEKMRAGLDGKAEQSAKEAASHLFGALAKTVGRHAEPYLVSVLGALLDLCGDKLAPVRAAAEPAAAELSVVLNPHAIKKVRQSPGRVKPPSRRATHIRRRRSIFGVDLR